MLCYAIMLCLCEIIHAMLCYHVMQGSIMLCYALMLCLCEISHAMQCYHAMFTTLVSVIGIYVSSPFT